MIEVCWVNAFVGPEAYGNATCVVMDERPGVDWNRAALARALRAPDTVFVEAASTNLRSVRFFSPQEGEMTFCGQGLIAANTALRQRTSNDAEFRLRTAVGDVNTQRDGADPAVTWFSVPSERVSSATPTELTPLFSQNHVSAHVVDMGRKRAFVLLADELAVDKVALEPQDVTAFCDERELSGVCFYALSGAAHVRFRVFTVSLGGREDATTGGAVLALGRLLPVGRWAIAQGAGGPLARGHLLLDSTDSASFIRVGGRCETVAWGTLERNFAHRLEGESVAE
jgi:PhzF family phenazine biosynthesis protein